ncbi:hypothetical protein ACH5RR_023834 [Cinchona calisaya]|uniref:Uncharacterized protein n=1 Tax=Cinchona calisaya TaxID=153742 RepID=A0ABD2ZFM7_9GENT
MEMIPNHMSFIHHRCGFNCRISQSIGSPWRLSATCFLLDDGLRFRMEDGRKARISEDKWLDDDWNGMIMPPKPTSCHHKFVSDMIHNGKWNVELLNEVFNDNDIRRIVKLSLSKSSGKD